MDGDLQELIRRRAEEIYIRKGRIPGQDVENWTQAEREIAGEIGSASGKRRAVIVKVNGTQYVGEYDPNDAGGYVPGEFQQGEPVPVRFVGKKMFLTRSGGAELETTVIQKTP